MPIANASLLDEATAVAEAMAMAHAVSKSKSDVLAVATDVHPQTRAVLATRAKPIGVTLVDVAPGDTAAIGAARPFALVLQYPVHRRAARAVAGDRRGARRRRAGNRRGGPAVTRGADAAWRDGRRCGGGLGAALRRADGLRRSACRVLRHARRVQAAHAGAAGRRVGRCQWCAGTAAGAANPRTTHSPRKGDVEYLHGTGVAGGDRRVLCGLAWTGGAQAHRPPRQPGCAFARRCGTARRTPPAPRRVLRYDRGGMSRRRWADARCAGSRIQFPPRR